MEEIGKNIWEKISSYNIFNNFFPGIVFCYLVSFFTAFKLDNGNTWENIFIYYFWGLILSRVGSVVIESFLLKIKIRNKKTKEKECYIKRAAYKEYSKVSEKVPFIKVLNENNNMFRTMVAVFAAVILIKTYELLSMYIIDFNGQLENLFELFFLIIGMVIFVFSYKKQTDYIRKRVQIHTDEEDKV